MCGAKFHSLLHDEIHVFSLRHGLSERDRAGRGRGFGGSRDFEDDAGAVLGIDQRGSLAALTIKNSRTVADFQAQDIEAVVGLGFVERGGFPVFRSEMEAMHIFRKCSLGARRASDAG